MKSLTVVSPLATAFLALAAPAFASFELPPLEQLDATRERPLFTPGRQPPPTAAPTVPEPARSARRLRLTGIASGGDGHGVALLSDPNRPGWVQRVSSGERIDGWTVRKVFKDRIELTDQDRQVFIQILGVIPSSAE